MDRTVTFHHHAWEELTAQPQSTMAAWLVALHIFQTYGAQHAGFILTQLAPPTDIHPQWAEKWELGRMQLCTLHIKDNENTSSFLAVRTVFDGGLIILAAGEAIQTIIERASARHIEFLETGAKTLGEYYAHQPPALRLFCENDIAFQGQKIGSASLLERIQGDIDSHIANLFALSPLRLKRYHTRVIFYLELLEKALSTKGLTWRWVIEKDGHEIISGKARNLFP